MILGKVLYVHADKFIVKVISDQNAPVNNGILIQLIKSQAIPEDVEKGSFINFSGAINVQQIRNAQTKELKSVSIVIPDKCEISKGKKADTVKEKRANNEKKKGTADRIAIDVADQKLYPVGSIHVISGVRVSVIRTGRSFEDKDTQKEICYVYYEKAKIAAEEFMQATRDYYAVIDFIKKNGIKPRHKPEMITLVKNSTVICDSRKKLEGNAWLAFNDEFMWYITYKLSPISVDNNIKIYNQMAQCWRISFRHIRDKMDHIQNIDQILFKSDIIPSA